MFQLRDILEKRKEEVRARHDELKNELSTERETVRLSLMAYLYYQIWARIHAPNPMATLHYAKVFTLHGVRFRFQS